jgi:choline dehydrogenase-like flavoprotein
MKHTSWVERGETFQTEADYVVVGSGAGGSVAAAELARGGAEVVLVEAGPWRRPEDYPHSMYGTLRDMMDDWGSQVTRGRALWPIVQGRLVGGTTVINSAIVVRTPGDIFREWEAEHGIGGDRMAEKVWKHQDELDRELVVSEVPVATRGRSNDLARAGAVAVGIHDHEMHRNVKDCLGRGNCLQGCRSLRKQSTNLNLIPEMLERGGELLSCAPADRVLFEGRRAVAVVGRFQAPVTRRTGGRFEVRARKAVVVAASATHSPALLLRSKVKNRALGQFFRAHPGTGVFGVYDDPVDMNTGATQGWSTTGLRLSENMKLETLSLPLELVASRLSGGGRKLMERLQDYRHLAMWVQAIRARAVGRVRVGLTGKPVVHYEFTPWDMERLRFGAHMVAQVHVAAGARSILPGIHGLPYSLKPDEIDVILDASPDPRAWTAILSHLFGGCVMGTDPERSVCDGRGWVHGYEGLVIADASGLPSTLGVNPQHTIMGVARMHAQTLLDELG